MPTKNNKDKRSFRWLDLHKEMSDRLPHLFSFLESTDEFAAIQFKARQDGTILAIAKGYDASGGPVVCFASGYDMVLCLLALDGAIQGDNWRVDKPWKPSK